MQSFKNKLASFMYGRYGVDPLYYGLLALYLIFLLLNIVFSSVIWSVLMAAALGYALFRSLSRNIPARRRENEVFLKFWHPLKTELKLFRDKWKDRKTARYRRCTHCHVIIRLPNEKGKHTVICPHCKKRFAVKIIL